MYNPNDIQQDPELPNGIDKSKSSGFTLPNDYFEQLRTKVYEQTTASGLSRIKDLGFIMPEAYFQNFSDNLWSRIQKEIPEGMPVGDGFRIPEDYFSQVNKEVVLQKVQERKSVVRFFQTKQTWIYGVAASIVILVSWLLITLFNIPQLNLKEELFSNCTEEELLEYMSVYATDFSQEHLALAVGELNLDEIYIEENLNNELEDMLIEYLQ